MKYIKFISLLICLNLGFVSCENNTQISNPESFKNSIDWHTGKEVSTKSNIEVKVSEGYTIKSLNVDQLKTLFVIQPEIEGTIEVIGENTFRFLPKENLNFNTSYHVTFNLDKVILESAKVKPFTFLVATKPLHINVQSTPMEAYSSDYQFSKVKIRSSDPLTINQLKDFLKLDAKSGHIKWMQEKGLEYTDFTVIIDSLKREVNDYTINLSWNAAYLGSESVGDFDLIIPGKNTFSVLQVEVEQEPNQIVRVHFSDPILKNQNFDGLVSLSGEDNLKFRVENNVLKIYPNSRLKLSKSLSISNNLKNENGYELKLSHVSDIIFEQLKPNIALLDNGTILPSSKNLFLNFESTNLHSVNVKIIKIFENNILQFLQRNSISGTWGLNYVGKEFKKTTIKLFDKGDINANRKSTHAIDLSNIIRVNPNAVYRVELSFNSKNSAYQCEETAEVLESTEYYDEYDDSYYSDYDYSNISYNDKDNPCTQSFYYYNSSQTKVATNILASNIGLTVKVGEDNTYHFAAVNMITNEVMPTTTIGLYSQQQQLLREVQTNSKGLAKITLKDETPYFAIATHQHDKVYLKIQDGRALSLSKFNVSGLSLRKGLKGFLYLERGVRRPGDQIPVTFVLDDSKNSIPDNHPVVFELHNPQGKLVKQKVVKHHSNHVYSHTFKTSIEDVTGNWLVKAKVGGAHFSHTVKIETVKPNRLKINAVFGDEDAEILNLSENIEGKLNVTWLHGAIADGLKADVRVKVSSKHTGFKDYPSYYFGNEARYFNGDETTIFDGELDENGEAVFNLQPDFNSRAPGFLRANFLTKVYEKGGDFSTNVESKTISPYETYVGMEMPKAKNRYNILYTNKDHLVNVVSVDTHGKPKPKSLLKVRVFKIDWRWWWHSGRENLSHYVNGSSYTPIYQTEVVTDASGKGKFNLNVPKEGWGRYFVYVEDVNGQHAAGKKVYIDWPDWEGRAASGNASAATMLSFSTDKKVYEVGETATVTIPSSEEGRALVSVESGSEVVDMLWVETKRGETKLSLPITEAMAPNVYLTVSLLQKHNNTINDIPIRKYGVQGIEVVNPNTKLAPRISMPESLRPEQEFELKVSESKGQPMTYTIQIVDEGLLDLTRYKTPNPWNYFYAKEALGVTTWDVYDDVIGAYGGTIDQILAIGGDGDAAGSEAKKANRFEPVAIHLGPFELPTSGSKTHKIKLPNYVGSVKTMVVASNTARKAYGSSSVNTPVKKPVMVLVSAPRVLAPGEEFTLPVNVFVMEDHIKDVQVSLKTNVGLKIIGASTKKVNFTRAGDQIVNFKVAVQAGYPIGELSVNASAGNEEAHSDIEFNIENPNLMSSVKYSKSIEKEGVFTIDFDAFGELNSNTIAVEFSNFPSINLSGRLGYLIGYPYGCLEQTTSKAFPQMYLPKIVDLSAEKQNEIQYNINEALKKLATFQRATGGLSYWPYSSYYQSWAEVYAAHFIVEAEANGYVLPLGLKDQLLKHFAKQAKAWQNSSNYSTTTQAYRLFVLAKANKAEVSTMNRLREHSELTDMARYRLAHAYILIGQSHVAKALIDGVGELAYSSPDHYRYNFGSVIRDKAFVLETELALGNLENAQVFAKEVASALNNNKHWMSTQTTAYAIRSMALYSDVVKTEGMDYTFSIDGDHKGEMKSKNGIEVYTTDISAGKYSLKVENKMNGPLFVSMVANGRFPVGADLSESRGLTITSYYKNLEGYIINVDSLKQGTNFIAEVSVRNNKKTWLSNVALSQLFPSGWEVVNTRFTDFDMEANPNTDYTDIRDAKVDYFFSIGPEKSVTFKVMINASYLGKYYLPGVQCEAMYDNDFFVRSKGKWIQVVK